MASSASAQPHVSHMTPPLGGDPDALSDQLEALWHYGVAVSAHSRSANRRFSSNASNLKAVASTRSASASQFGHDARAPQNPYLQRVFSTFDEDDDGIVSVNEISRIFEKLGIDCSTESLLAGLVTKSPGYVDEQEFLSFYESVCCSDSSASSSDLHADVEQDLVAAFNVFDKDGNGFISPAELQSVLWTRTRMAT